MKKNILLLILLVFVLGLHGQINMVEQIEYAKDSMPVLIKFKPDLAKHKHSNAKDVIKKYLNLSKEDNLTTKKYFTDEMGFVHERFQHYFKGLKVEFSEYNVHSKEGIIYAITGKLKIVKSVNTKPTLTEQKALDLALEYVNAEVYMWEVNDMECRLKKEKGDNTATYYPKGELVIWTDWKFEKAELAYKFNVYSQAPYKHDYIYVDAHTGNIIDVQQILKNDEVVGSGSTKYSGTRYFTADSFSGGYRLRDYSRGDGIETLDMNCGTDFSLAVDFVDNNNNWTASEWNNTQMDNAALDAHHAAQLTYDYFKQPILNRNGWDDNNSILRLYVHYHNNFNNAYWDPYASQIVLGDGDGVIFHPLTDLDVVAHEFAHGISDDEVGFNTSGQPGSLDEGLSDIWAACVEEYANISGNNIWVMGEDFKIDPNERRNMQNPNASHYHPHSPSNPPQPYPDTYLGTGWYYGAWNYHGRHVNSTVISHWFYLLSQGGAGINDNGDSFHIFGIGINNAAKIVYHMERTRLGSASNFSDARIFSILSAQELFGPNSNEVIETTNAWHAVGVGDDLPMYITGNNLVCTSNRTFTLENPLPSGTIVTWTNSDNLTYVSGQGTNSYTVKALNSITSGVGWVKAKIVDNTLIDDPPSSVSPGNTLVLEEIVWVGKPGLPVMSPDVNIQNVGVGDNFTVRITSSPGADPKSGAWSADGSLSIFYDDQGPTGEFIAIETGDGRYFVETSNACGISPEAVGYVDVQDGTGGQKLTISPNPATTQVVISLKGETPPDSNTDQLSQLIIYDFYGQPVYSKAMTQRSVQISTQSWNKGVYYVTFVKGKEQISNTFIVQ